MGTLCWGFRLCRRSGGAQILCQSSSAVLTVHVGLNDDQDYHKALSLPAEGPEGQALGVVAGNGTSASETAATG